MVGTIFRVLLGLIAANLAAGVVAGLSFIITPADLAALKGEALTDRAARAWACSSCSQRRRARSSQAPWPSSASYSRNCGGSGRPFSMSRSDLAVAGAGFLAQHLGGRGSTTATADPYALAAYGATGFVAGLVYWWTSGRGAGGGRPRRFSGRLPSRSFHVHLGQMALSAATHR